MLTRDEFIERYLIRSDLPLSYKVDGGFDFDGRRYLALPCACGDDMCEGWAKVRDDPEEIATHMRLYAPLEA